MGKGKELKIEVTKGVEEDEKIKEDIKEEEKEERDGGDKWMKEMEQRDGGKKTDYDDKF